jgi:hypothetical protein
MNNREMNKKQLKRLNKKQIMVRRPLMQKQFLLNMKYIALEFVIFIIIFIEITLDDLNKGYTMYTLLTGWLPLYFIQFLIYNTFIYSQFDASLHVGDLRRMKISKQLIWVVNIGYALSLVALLFILNVKFPFFMFNSHLSLVTYFLSISMFALFFIFIGYKIINAITNKGIKKIIINNNERYNIK